MYIFIFFVVVVLPSLVNKALCVSFLQCFDAVGWVPEMTYKVSSGTLNLCSLTLCVCNLAKAASDPRRNS